jgi:hypothetical protein
MTTSSRELAMSEPDAESYLDYYRATWSLFVALEKGDQEAIEGIWEAYDDDALLRGWHMISMRLRQELQRHADHLECDCGSDAWLERERLRNVGIGD